MSKQEMIPFMGHWGKQLRDWPDRGYIILIRPFEIGDVIQIRDANDGDYLKEGFPPNLGRTILGSVVHELWTHRDNFVKEYSRLYKVVSREVITPRVPIPMGLPMSLEVFRGERQRFKYIMELVK